MTEKQPRNTRAAHLEPYRWKAGQSGNPKGRPKKRTLTERLHEELDREFKSGTTNWEEIVRVVVREAIKGKPWAFTEIFDRLDPKRKKLEMDIEAPVQPPDLSMLTDHELDLFDEIARKVYAEGTG